MGINNKITNKLSAVTEFAGFLTLSTAGYQYAHAAYELAQLRIDGAEDNFYAGTGIASVSVVLMGVGMYALPKIRDGINRRIHQLYDWDGEWHTQ